MYCIVYPYVYTSVECSRRTEKLDIRVIEIKLFIYTCTYKFKVLVSIFRIIFMLIYKMAKLFYGIKFYFIGQNTSIDPNKLVHNSIYVKFTIIESGENQQPLMLISIRYKLLKLLQFAVQVIFHKFKDCSCFSNGSGNVYWFITLTSRLLQNT